jgi:DNA-binding response OmpR family regulator
LDYAGYKTNSAVNAEEAFRVVRQEPLAVNVLALLLPGMNGFEFFDELVRILKAGIFLIIWTFKDLIEEQGQLRLSALLSYK